jgi:hypothetical protein
LSNIETISLHGVVVKGIHVWIPNAVMQELDPAPV